MISQVVASERERAQTGHVAMHVRCCRTTTLHDDRDPMHLESCTGEGDSPVGEAEVGIVVS